MNEAEILAILNLLSKFATAFPSIASEVTGAYQKIRGVSAAIGVTAAQMAEADGRFARTWTDPLAGEIPVVPPVQPAPQPAPTPTPTPEPLPPPTPPPSDRYAHYGEVFSTQPPDSDLGHGDEVWHNPSTWEWTVLVAGTQMGPAGFVLDHVLP